MKNDVSVVIPTYNRADLAPRAIRSVLAAVRPGDEVVVVDDGSTDDTAAVLRQFGDSIRYVRIENSGPGAARNVGIRMSRSQYLAFLDSDDAWIADKLELQRHVLDAHPSLVFCFGNMYETKIDGRVVHDLIHADMRNHVRIGSDTAPRLTDALGSRGRYSSIAPLPEGRADFNVYIGDMYPLEMAACYVHGNAVLIRRELAGVVRFPEDIRPMEDYEFFARLSKLGPAAYLDCELANMNQHVGPRATDVENVKQLTLRINLLKGVYGSDESFMKIHSARYMDILASKVRIRARLLITSGRLDEARESLRERGAPWSYRLIASLPSPLVDNAVRWNRRLKALTR